MTRTVAAHETSGQHFCWTAVVKRVSPLFLPPLYYCLYFVVQSPDWLAADAGVFSKVQESPFRYAIDRYTTWSSRLWLEGAMVVASKHLLFFWLVSVAMLVLLLYSVSSILKSLNIRDNLLLAGTFIALFPINALSTAGWVATTVVYLWPIALFSWWVLVSEKHKEGQANLLEISTGFICLILSVMNETITLALLSYLIIQLFLNSRKLLNRFFIFSECILLASVLNILLCPGNAAREGAEAMKWFPQYASFTAWDRLILQFSHISNDLFTTYSTISMIFVLLLLVLCTAKRKFAASLLLVLSLSIQPIVAPLLHERFSAVSMMSLSNQLTQESINSLYKVCLLVLTVFVCIFVSIIQLFGWGKKGIVLAGSLSAGIVIGLIASMSPTLIASADRPYILLYFLLVFGCFFLCHEVTAIYHKLVIDSTRALQNREVLN